MVLESLINPDKAESTPSWMMLMGAIYTTIALFLAYFIYKGSSSIFMICIVTIAAMPIMYRLTKMEEQKDTADVNEKFLLKEHSKALKSFMYLFIGSTLAFALWYTVLSPNMVSTVFDTQISTLSNINPHIDYNTVTAHASSAFSGFTTIFFNNVKVLLFCILFSFLYGAGAIFILIWNASVVGAAIGNYIRSGLASAANLIGAPSLGSYFGIISKGILRYSIHGIPEILAYFIGALAGGIISIAVINHDFSTQKFEHILLDSADLIMLSMFVLFIAALLEVFVTPTLF
jgi:uncharacterized membrane protein SpoIIM required for sporulation